MPTNALTNPELARHLCSLVEYLPPAHSFERATLIAAHSLLVGRPFDVDPVIATLTAGMDHAAGAGPELWIMEAALRLLTDGLEEA